MATLSYLGSPVGVPVGLRHMVELCRWPWSSTGWMTCFLNQRWVTLAISALANSASSSPWSASPVSSNTVKTPVTNPVIWRSKFPA